MWKDDIGLNDDSIINQVAVPQNPIINQVAVPQNRPAEPSGGRRHLSREKLLWMSETDEFGDIDRHII
jgi:hypothetical protein